jgi:hypothetical protein
VVLGMSQRRLGLAPLRALWKHRVPVVVTVNDDWPVAFARSAPRSWSARLSDLLDRSSEHAADFGDLVVRDAVYVSRTIRDAVLRSGAPLPRGTVCAQGIDRALFTPAPRRTRSAEDALELLLVGRLHPSKAPDAAIDTLAELRSRGIHACLTLAGNASDPAYEASLRGSRPVARPGHEDRAPRRLPCRGRLPLSKPPRDRGPGAHVSRGHVMRSSGGRVSHRRRARAARRGGRPARVPLRWTLARRCSLRAEPFASRVAALDRYVDTLAERLVWAASSRPARRASCEDAPRRSSCTAW